MCIGIPLQVVRNEGSHAICRSADGEAVRIDTLLTGPQPEGCWLMTFLGAARAVISAEEARQSQAALTALETLMAGGMPDLDAAFADLLDRPPQLPDFLRETKT
ncbi:MAG: HypC/HybG/HupF family hydrogenase formation chaperone [Parazoarcus communis]